MLLWLEFYMHPKLFPFVLILIFPVTCQQTCRFVLCKQEKILYQKQINLVYIYLWEKLFIIELVVGIQT